MDGIYSETELMSCLGDCGFTREERENFQNAVLAHDRNLQCCLLKRKRWLLMDSLHDMQHKIDCIDYLLLKLKQKEKEDG